MGDDLEKCGNCKFWLDSEPNYITDNKYGYCRIRVVEKSSGISGFHFIRKNDWCGEYEPKGNSYAAVHADYLEEHGHKEAADVLRQFCRKNS